MQSVHTPVEQDRRHWHLDKTLNVSHLLTTVVIAGSLYLIGEAMELLGLSPVPAADEKALNNWQPKQDHDV